MTEHTRRTSKLKSNNGCTSIHPIGFLDRVVSPALIASYWREIWCNINTQFCQWCGHEPQCILWESIDTTAPLLDHNQPNEEEVLQKFSEQNENEYATDDVEIYYNNEHEAAQIKSEFPLQS